MCRSSNFNVMFDCFVDDVFISARTAALLSLDELNTALATVSLPGGLSYSVIDSRRQLIDHVLITTKEQQFDIIYFCTDTCIT